MSMKIIKFRSRGGKFTTKSDMKRNEKNENEKNTYEIKKSIKHEIGK